jgi:hypothetical protein
MDDLSDEILALMNGDTTTTSGGSSHRKTRKR